jgi:hypothetical protein
MSASDAESWAKLRLVEGDSSAKKWELVSSLGHTTLTVGSNSDCTWVVRAEGVRPIHFSLHWDGGTLRAADVYSAGDVRVDGTALTSQWRPLVGRARIEFGRAAMVVESSAAASPSTPPKSAEHPLEGPMRNDSKRPSSRAGKETLIGVAPSMIAGLVTPSQRPESSSPPPGHSSPAGPASSRPPARSMNDRSMKATLVGGIGISPVPTPLSQQAPSLSGKPNATLMGVSPSDPVRGLVGNQTTLGIGPAGSGLGSADQRTVQGVPREPGVPSPNPPSSQPSGRRQTVKGMVSQPPGVSPDAVSRPPTRNVASDRPREQRINSAWQERAEDLGTHTLRGITPPEEDEYVPGAPRIPRTDGRLGEFGERLSDIPTQMRDPASFESRRPRRGFPWRYVGVLLLTSVAYFAWLYLLDHM